MSLGKEGVFFPSFLRYIDITFAERPKSGIW